MVMGGGIVRPLAILALVATALLPVQPVAAQTAPDTDFAAMIRSRRPGPISDANLRVAAATMDEGRAALRNKKFPEAIQLFTKVLGLSENEYSAEAEELLGLAYQRSGKLAAARAIYEDCLRRYPGGEQGERVRQRLAGISPGPGDVSAALQTPPGAPAKGVLVGKFTKSDTPSWKIVGTVSSFYMRDDAFVSVRDRSTAPNPALNVDDALVQQNAILTSVNLLGTWNNDSTSGRFRFDAGVEHRFETVQNGPTGSQVDQFGVSQASVDVVLKNLNLRAIIGRQTYNGNGIFGRFDGAVVSWLAFPFLKLDVFAGSSANSRFNLPFDDPRYFYGFGIGTGPQPSGIDASVYFNEQRSGSLLDRRAVGADIKYSDPTRFAFANVDYDLSFQALGQATISGSWTFPNKATVYGGADYRRVPFLSSSNVLLNRPFNTLYDFLKNQIAIGQPLNSDQVKRIVLDETPVYKSAMLGLSYPLTDKLQISADATVANLSQAIIPAALLDPTLAQLAAGNEYYFSTQLIGTSIFKEGDMFIGAFHYAQQSTDKQYVLDFSARWPTTKDLMVSPRLRLGYAEFLPGAVLNNGQPTGINVIQYTVMPSLQLNYNWSPNLTFEAEVGTQLTYALQPTLKTRDTEVFVTAGFRYSFDLFGDSKADRLSTPRSPVAAAICRYTARTDGSCATPTSASP
jgi:hypothetical protein